MRKLSTYEIEKLKEHWANFQTLYDEFLRDVEWLERDMQEDLEIEDLEFINIDGSYCGIGNLSRTIKLIHSDELEDE